MLVFVDFESHFDPANGYTLKKQTPAEYILDPRWQVHGMAAKFVTPGTSALGGHVEWFDAHELPAFFDYLRTQPDVRMVTYNALFDQSICAWRYGYIPPLMIDVLGMVRALYGPILADKSLGNVARYLELPTQKGTMPHVQGMRTDQIKANPQLWNDFITYGKADIYATAGIYDHAIKTFPISELHMMDLVLRTTVDPMFRFNVPLLESHLVDLKTQKAALLDAAGLQYDEHGRIPELMSAAKFKVLLEGLGVVVEDKVSQITGRAIPALAKKDDFMQGLLEDPDPMVATLAAARLGHKSTLEETRTKRYITMAGLSGGFWSPSAAPMPLRYGAAHTHRLGGDWKLNCMHPDVELLTPRGWQRVEDWQPNTPVMQWWPDGRLSFDDKATKVERSEDTELVWFNSPFVKGGFTRDHRMVAMKSGCVVERTAGWIADHSGLYRVPVTGVYSSEQSALTVEQVRVLVALAADGSRLRPSSPHWQWGFHKRRKVERLRGLLTAAGVEFREYFDGKRYTVVTLPVVRACTGRPTQGHDWIVKGFGVWVLSLGPVEMDALLDEVVHWDGYTNTNSGAVTFCTSLRDQALWIQTIGHLRGRACTVKPYNKITTFSNGAITRQWYVYFRASNFTSAKGEVRPYVGKTYCPTVESSYVLARYGEGVFVTGQCQNMPAGRAGRSNKIRQAIEVDVDHVIMTADMAQIEARLSGWLAGEKTLLQEFADDLDPYGQLGASIFDLPFVPGFRKIHVVEGFIGKTGILGLGYQAGAPRFWRMVRSDAKIQLGRDVDFTMDQAELAVRTYRTRYSAMPIMWRYLGSEGLAALTCRALPLDVGPFHFAPGEITGPGGLKMVYPDLQNDEKGEWTYRMGKKRSKIYGGKILENITQFGARIIVMDAALRLWTTYGIRMGLQAHDELVFKVRKDDVEMVKMIVLNEMTLVPAWAPGLPLKAEIGVGANYGSAKG